MKITRTCPRCRQTREIEVDGVSYYAWEHGLHIQRAFPGLTPGQREEIKSGYHEECFDEDMSDILDFDYIQED